MAAMLTKIYYIQVVVPFLHYIKYYAVFISSLKLLFKSFFKITQYTIFIHTNPARKLILEMQNGISAANLVIFWPDLAF